MSTTLLAISNQGVAVKLPVDLRYGCNLQSILVMATRRNKLYLRMRQFKRWLTSVQSID